jgi:uncharacterized protein YbjQ (UPF0145 family)
MIGTAASHPVVTQYGLGQNTDGVITSDLTAEETWNVARMGYVPLQLVLGTSVYSLGMMGGIKSALQNFVKGEITPETQMVYGARQESLKRIQEQAQGLGADDVLGIKTYVYELGSNLLEFLAIGTAVKRINGIRTRSDQLPPQAIIRDKDTFVNNAQPTVQSTLNKQQQDAAAGARPGTPPHN